MDLCDAYVALDEPHGATNLIADCMATSGAAVEQDDLFSISEVR
jgi:hypothetical protein